jgi:hypothetical protein
MTIDKQLIQELINATYAVLSENTDELKLSPKLERLEELLTFIEETLEAEQE